MNLPTSKFAEIDATVVCIFVHSIGTVTTVKQKLSFDVQWSQSETFSFLSERNETKISEKKIQRYYRDWFVLLDQQHNIDKKTSIVMETNVTSFPSLRNSTVSARLTVFRCLQAEDFSALGQPYIGQHIRLWTLVLGWMTLESNIWFKLAHIRLKRLFQGSDALEWNTLHYQIQY